MDLYQEARWTFTTTDRVVWYKGIVQSLLVAPRLARFGGLTSTCAEQCQEIVGYRFATDNALALFADVGNLEYNDPCKICLEQGYQATIEALHGSLAPAFVGLSQQVQAYNATLTADDAANATQIADNNRIVQNLQALAASVTTNDVADFYNYYVTRGLYAQLGASAYLKEYAALTPQIEACQAAAALGLYAGLLACPTHPSDMNAQLAARDLLRHADNVFSNVTAAGAPFPFWSSGDGTGVLFFGNLPVSGSGVTMSAEIESLGVYLATSGNVADPTSAKWQTQVEVNPLYAWFMAGLEPVDPAEAVCANGNLTGNSPESNAMLAAMTPRWCTPFDRPAANTKQDVARMWYDLLIASDRFLDVIQGQGK